MTASSPLNERALRETVAQFVCRPPEEIGASADFCDDLGLDSIDRLDLLAAIEERHGVYLRDEQVSEITTLAGLVEALVPGGDGGGGS